ncbi:MAG TPA: hypothetical protein VJ939_04760, partial [Bacteroidales bacterium]|nr:hypothetical protein [Bacteroidales bacterium]
RPQESEIINRELLLAPPENGEDVELVKGPNIKTLPKLNPLKDTFKVPVLLKMKDNISTDEILRAGADVLPLRSNLPEISKWAYFILDKKFHKRSLEAFEKNEGHVVVAGDNYAQGSSREHAALAPRYLGQQAVIAKSYARIGWQNLVNFGIAPLEFVHPDDYDKIQQEDIIQISGLRDALKNKENVTVKNTTQNQEYETTYSLSDRQIEVLLAGGIIQKFREQ